MSPTARNIVCFYHGNINVSLLNPHICTHIIYTSIGIDKNGNLTFPYVDVMQVLSELNFLEKSRKINENLKLLISIGDNCAAQRKNFNLMLSSEAARKHFAKNILGFCRKCNFDGIDLNWQHPQPRLAKNFSDLLKKLKELLSGVFAADMALPTEFEVFSFDSSVEPQILSVTVNGTEFKNYEIKRIAKRSKFVNLMSFDMELPSRELIDVDQAVSIWVGNGCPLSKLNIGVTTYGCADIKEMISKGNYVRVGGLAGIAIHAFDGDDYSRGYPLIRSLFEIFESN